MDIEKLVKHCDYIANGCGQFMFGWFSKQRLLDASEKALPAELEQVYFNFIEPQALAARLLVISLRYIRGDSPSYYLVI